MGGRVNGDLAVYMIIDVDYRYQELSVISLSN